MDDLFLHDSLDTSPIVSSKCVLYTPTSFAKSALLYLQEIGSLRAEQPHISSSTHLSSYLFFCVNSGEGKLDYHWIINEYQERDWNRYFSTMEFQRIMSMLLITIGLHYGLVQISTQLI